LHPCHPGALLQSLLLSLHVCHHPSSLLWKSPLLLHLLSSSPRRLLLRRPSRCTSCAPLRLLHLLHPLLREASLRTELLPP
jgi:hypothetical protein